MNTTHARTLMARLKRVEGQVRGLERMLENNTYCIDLIRQAQAARNALASFEQEMLKNHLETHVLEQVRGGKGAKAVKELLAVYKVSHGA